MKVTLLGTSSAEGWPGLFCRCEACGKARRLGGKNIRTRSSALIDEGFKIDFPPDTLHHVIQFNLDLRCLTSVLFTHAHDDHFSPPEFQYMSDYFVPSPILEPLPVYGPREVIHRLESGLDLNRVPITLTTLQPWQSVQIGNYRVTPIMAQHDKALTCFNYVIEDREGASLLYASDTGWYEEPTWEFLQGVHLDGVVAECAKGPVEGGYMAHMCIPEVIQMRQKLIESGSLHPDSPVVTTHFSHLGGLMHEELEATLNPHGIQAGYDGMTFHIHPRRQCTPAPELAASAPAAS
ncbi:MAG TPA: MBL fold metallo-hydrolase [Chthonomonadaceae bacterium]|nr:MBL fold metallo-hydrolase [Chthonomonadaceae bacterium]